MALLGTYSSISALIFFMNGVSGIHRKYCVVGAGPAGVQLGHFMSQVQCYAQTRIEFMSAQEKRDFVLIDRAPAAASFFSKVSKC